MKKNEFVELRRLLNFSLPNAETLVHHEDIHSLVRALKPYKTDIELIRLGPQGDGGYLVPDDLMGIAACFSPGIGNITGFEKDCDKHGMKVYCADKSVETTVESDSGFNYINKYIGKEITSDFITLDNWVNVSGVEEKIDLLLQMDIEGFEYDVFEMLSKELLKRFRIIVVEFHYLDLLTNKAFFESALNIFSKLLENHVCVHLHPNNCCGIKNIYDFEIPLVLEFTFIRRDRIRTLTPATDFPHPLDFNNTKRANLPLPLCWYKMINFFDL